MDHTQVRTLFGVRWIQLVRLAGLLRAEDPEDVAAKAFRRLYERRSSIRSDDAGFSYLTRSVVNLIHDRARRTARLRVLTAPPANIASTTEPTNDPDMSGAVQLLPRRQREVVILRYWLDLSERDIANALGITTGSVKTHLFRALTSLRTNTTKEDNR